MKPYRPFANSFAAQRALAELRPPAQERPAHGFLSAAWLARARLVGIRPAPPAPPPGRLARIVLHLRCIARKLGRSSTTFHFRGILRELHRNPNQGGTLL